jgi:hypothetical protein
MLPSPPPGNRQDKEHALGPDLPKQSFLLRNIAVAGAILAPLWLSGAPALAATERPLSNITHDVIDFLGIDFLGIGPAHASTKTQPETQAFSERPKAELSPREIAPMPVADVEAPPPRLPVLMALTPSVETPLHRLFCVEYARMRSGLTVFGDAKYWWEHARNLYARASRPVEEAVMVFAGSKRLKRGHVAVVTEILGPRQITVDQANWQNKGEIDHATPVLDVSARNDWSKVRVWDIRSGTFGAHVYAISGFIAKEFRTASRD